MGKMVTAWQKCMHCWCEGELQFPLGIVLITPCQSTCTSEIHFVWCDTPPPSHLHHHNMSAVICLGARVLPLSFFLHCNIELLTKGNLPKLPLVTMATIIWSTWIGHNHGYFVISTKFILTKMHPYQVSRGSILYLNSLQSLKKTFGTRLILN